MKKHILTSIIVLTVLLTSCSNLQYQEEDKNEEYNYYLLLINKENPLDNNYIPSNLTPITYVDYIVRENESMLLDQDVLRAYTLLYNDASKQGLSLTIFSGYRSFEKQQTLFEKSKNESYVAKPGFSEHQSGLAIDISRRDIGLTTNFMYTKEYKFLKDNAYKYGFINRYPKEKEKITGYPFEPWHYRYVGNEIAEYLYLNNLTLEEYFA